MSKANNTPPAEPFRVYGKLSWDRPGELAAAIDRLSEAALFGLPLINLPMIFDPTRPSSVRVFGKSLHMLTAGWALSVVAIWFAGVQQSMLRDGVAPADYGLAVLLTGVVSSLLLEAFAFWVTRQTGRAPLATLQRREWHHAFWWSLFPNLMLWATAYLMISSAY
jgi:hypothetical protein